MALELLGCVVFFSFKVSSNFKVHGMRMAIMSSGFGFDKTSADSVPPLLDGN